MASKLIDRIPTLLRLPLRGLMAVTVFVIACAIIIAVVSGLYWVGYGIYAWLGKTVLLYIGFGLLLLFGLTWLGATMEDEQW